MFVPILKNASAQANTAQTAKASPLAPDALKLCFAGGLTAGDPTFTRPATTDNTACSGQPSSHYDQYTITLSGCSGTGSITAMTCDTTGNAAACSSVAASFDSLLYIYGSVFDPADACGVGKRYIVGNNNGCNPAAIATAAGLANGTYNIVVGSNLVNATGTYTLTLTTTGTGCSITPVSPTHSNGVITGRITDADGTPVSGGVINLSGSQSRKTISDANGNYFFGEVETNGFYSVTPSRANFSFAPGERSFSLVGNSTEATFTGSLTGTDFNPLDTPEYYVRQHYLDFLGREPDESGFNFWSDQMLSCGTDFNCMERRRVNVSAAYFLSIEFQKTGGLVDSLYRASYGRRPLYGEFMPDVANLAQDVVVARSGWEQQLTTNKRAFLDAWVQRAAFRDAYDLLTDDRYVDALIAHTGVSFTPSERDSLVMGLNLGSLSRTDVLQRVAEDERFARAKSNEAFVMMEYFGYLRRDPDESGFQYWLNKLSEFNGNFERAEMVKAFTVSSEYRDRFSR
jgi:hypothetical protein